MEQVNTTPFTDRHGVEWRFLYTPHGGIFWNNNATLVLKPSGDMMVVGIDEILVIDSSLPRAEIDKLIAREIYGSHRVIE